MSSSKSSITISPLKTSRQSESFLFTYLNGLFLLTKDLSFSSTVLASLQLKVDKKQYVLFPKKVAFFVIYD